MKGFRGSLTARAAHAAFIIMVLYMMLPSVACADMSEEEKNFLLMYFKEEELQVVSSTRSLKPISRVAENMTVVTAADIERMNAHTLAEVLNTVNGVVVWPAFGTPGTTAEAEIDGSFLGHVKVLIDGVPQNNLGSNFTDLGIIPVQNIEKVEIIKGPASSVWGSSLGGVVNVITKNPFDSGVHGTASVSYGTRNTEDYRAEIGGRTGDVGLYLSAGGIHSDGLRFGSAVLNNNIYSKLTYALTSSTDITASGLYLTSHRERGDFRWNDEMDKDRTEQYFGTMALSSRVAHNLFLDVSAYAQRQRVEIDAFVLSTGDLSNSLVTDDKRYGGTAKATLKLESQTIVAGFDYDRGTEKNINFPEGKQTLTKWAIFANDSVNIGDLSLIPGIRYEATNQNGDFVSPSFGATYMLTKRTILRGTITRGFNIPSLGDTFVGVPNPDLRMEKIMSYQVGVETGELKYVWVKASLFRHDSTDVLTVTDSGETVNSGKERRQGFEAEIKTVPFYNTVLSAGTTYIYAKDLETNQIIRGVPKYTYDLSLTYDDNKSFKAQMKARYAWWNADAVTLPQNESKYSNFIVDVSLAKTIFKHKDRQLEAFAVGHNLLNANQYKIGWYRNAGRWAEVGLRFKL